MLDELLEMYDDLKELITWRHLVVGGSLSAVLYTVYSFGIKPFFSPLRKIPGPGYNPLFGNVREASTGEAFQTSVSWVKKYGGVLRFYHILGRERVLVADPEALRRVLVTNVENYVRSGNNFLGRQSIFNVSGEEHKYQRRILNPHFGREALNGHLPVFTEHAELLVNHWRSKCQNGLGENTEIDVQKDLYRLALDIIGETVFGYKFDSLENLDSPEASAFNKLTSEFDMISFTRAIPLLSRMRLIFGSERRFQKNLKMTHEVIGRMIEEKRILLTSEEGHEAATRDLLGKLMVAKDEVTGQQLTEGELKGQVLSLLFAGHETTALTMSWLLLTLAQHPDIQNKVRSEVTRVLPSGDEAITWEVLQKLEYLTCVIKEGQRLYPAAPSFQRKAVNDDHLGGYFIPAGTMVIIHFATVMRTASVWPDPEKFDPDRFLPDKDIGLYKYLPFNTGPHKCLGHQFAKIELKIVLAHLIRNFHFKTIPGTSYKRKTRITLKPVPAVRLYVSPVLE